MLLSLAAVGALSEGNIAKRKQSYQRMIRECFYIPVLANVRAIIYGFQHFVTDVEWLSNLKFCISTFTYRITGFLCVSEIYANLPFWGFNTCILFMLVTVHHKVCLKPVLVWLSTLFHLFITTCKRIIIRLYGIQKVLSAHCSKSHCFSM